MNGDPRSFKLREWRRGFRHGCRTNRFGGCKCDYCVPEKRAGFKARMRRAWRTPT